MRLLRIACGSWALVCLAAAAPVGGQQNQSSAYRQIPDDAPAIQPAPTFKTGANLVLVRVVVRDREGKPIPDLKKDDFQLFDKGKRQSISRFAMERSGSGESGSREIESTEAKPIQVESAKLPERYIAFVFDDVHIDVGDLMLARRAAEQYFSELPLRSSRAAIYTTSGQIRLNFTDDVTKLREALLRIQPQSRQGHATADCPDITYYWADLIQNKHDPDALQAAVDETMVCANLDHKMLGVAQSIARSTASKTVSVGELETRNSLGVLSGVVRRMTAAPGQRTIVLVSPGFLAEEQQAGVMEVIDRAVRANVVISGLNARGLYALAPGDIGQSGPANLSSANRSLASRYRETSAMAESDVLAELADGTGGKFFHNNNDLKAGLRQLASTPEYYYVLGFSPQNLKYDGAYHSLKVTLEKSFKSFSVQARRGYFAPTHEVTAAEEAKLEIRELLLSRNEYRGLPVTLQVSKTRDAKTNLTVVANVDLGGLDYEKAHGRNVSSFSVISGIFDRNGKCVSAIEKTVYLHLKDRTLARKKASGITIKTPFDLAPGSYVVRLVVREAEGQKMAALNGAVEIP